jgi:hypothetical protein
MSLQGAWHRLRELWGVLGQARLVELARWPLPGQPRVVLNDGDGEGGGLSASEQLARLGTRLEGDAFTAEGRVDYRGLAASPVYGELEAASRALARAPVPEGGDAERTALWINLYNVLTVHGIIALGIERSVMEIPTFFARVSYRVAGHELSLDEMESLLRGNRPLPVSGRPAFASGDPRLALAPSTFDARVHGALVCAGQSCPPIAFYSAERLDAQLDVAAANLAGAVVVDEPSRTLTVPPVFRWYEDDFGGRAGMLDFIARHARRPDLERAIAAGPRLRFATHRWGLNAP